MYESYGSVMELFSTTEIYYLLKYLISMFNLRKVAKTTMGGRGALILLV